MIINPLIFMDIIQIILDCDMFNYYLSSEVMKEYFVHYISNSYQIEFEEGYFQFFLLSQL